MKNYFYGLIMLMVSFSIMTGAKADPVPHKEKAVTNIVESHDLTQLNVVEFEMTTPESWYEAPASYLSYNSVAELPEPSVGTEYPRTLHRWYNSYIFSYESKNFSNALDLIKQKRNC